MKTIKIFLIAVFTALFGLTSCSNDDSNIDTERPLIEVVAPSEGAILVAGKDVHFDMQVSDNVMLGSYKVDIHHNFDNHNHPTSLSNKENDDLVAFVFNKSWDLNNQKNADIHHHEIVIPANAKPGKYHFVVHVVDKAGNEAKVALNINIVQPSEPEVQKGHPTVNLVAPTEGTVLVAGKDIHFDMEATDEEMLESYKVEINSSSDSHNHTAIFSKTWSLAGSKEVDIHHHEIVIPANATPGAYLFKVTVINKAGNETSVTRNVTITDSNTGGGHDHDHDHGHSH